MRRLTLITENFSSNSTGRTYCLWLLAKNLGYDVSVLSTQGQRFWKPLDGSLFQADCDLLETDTLKARLKSDKNDLVIACKPLPESLGIAASVPSTDRPPLGVDIDDPDLEYRLSIESPLKRLGKAILRPKVSQEYRKLRRLAKELPSIVSNPWLQDRYDGIIVPHVRSDPGMGAKHISETPHIAFVGSNKPHKGVPTLRNAVEKLQSEGFTLTVTDDPPVDAKPWENWVGATSMEDGIALLKRCDIAVIANSDIADARGQLPAKLMDAMIAGRATVVSNVPPTPWAVQDAALIVPPDDSAALVASLRSLKIPAVRQRLGDSARDLALNRYTVESNVERFADFCDHVADGR